MLGEYCFEFGHEGERRVWGRSESGKLRTAVQAEPNPGLQRKGWAGDLLGRRKKVLL